MGKWHFSAFCISIRNFNFCCLLLITRTHIPVESLMHLMDMQRVKVTDMQRVNARFCRTLKSYLLCFNLYWETVDSIFFQNVNYMVKYLFSYHSAPSREADIPFKGRMPPLTTSWHIGINDIYISLWRE